MENDIELKDIIANTTRNRLHITELSKDIANLDKEKMEIDIIQVFAENPELGSYDQSNGWIEIEESLVNRNRKRRNRIFFIQNSIFPILYLFLGIRLLEYTVLFGALLIGVSIIHLSIVVAKYFEKASGEDKRWRSNAVFPLSGRSW